MVDNKTYKVIIYKYKTGMQEAIIGSGLNEKNALKRVDTGLSRCNSNYGTKAICEQDGEVL